MAYLIIIAFVAGFACGWAFFKHRTGIRESVKEKL